ncbi:hypothetical protein ONS95_007106 [Cadophora gregata]|uniref:uncharacterized protein n=1 Tax=Cadophora gregata TaxID=51156 RepID=UPI0026DAF7D1|nr:uncharacterized protein ONS95_007106 [Cadophora gregata]KAK0100653.1 hypothetical protein ONS95_007106 [Cadophora gregata]KAK0117349.1 hypothetical protein ONS96_013180 [Cadophora gregata f. sp. sojae]
MAGISTAMSKLQPGTHVPLVRPRFGDMLSIELWIMISGHLLHLQSPDSHDLRSLRLVSWKLYHVSTPYYYRTFIVLPHHLVRRPSTLGKDVLSNVRKFSQNIVVNQSTPTFPARLVEFMAECPHLKSLEYRLYLTLNRSANFPAEVALADQMSHLRLHINVRKSNPLGPPYGLYINFPTITHSNLVSLDLMSHVMERIRDSDMDQLRDLLVRSVKLRTLRIMGSRVFESWHPIHGRMPPLRDLFLARWSTTAPRGLGHPISQHSFWDLSKLSKLSSRSEIVFSTVPTFMGSFSSFFVAGLKSFEYSPSPRLGPLSPTEVEVKHHKRANQDILQLIRDNGDIEELFVTCYFVSEIIPAITITLGQTLRALRLRSPEFLDPDTSLEDVIALRSSCVVLIDLEISITFPDRVEVAHYDPGHPTWTIICELSKIRSLQRLKLVAQSPSYSVDQSPQMQKAIIEILRDDKIGAPLSQLSLLFPHCKKFHAKYESRLVEYTWDVLGEQTCKRSRELVKVDQYHMEYDDEV